MNSDDLITLMFQRQNRDKLLVDSDKYLLPDFPINSSNLELIKQYRQELRNYMELEQVVNYNSSCNIPLPPFPQLPF